jgi:hypothetical protein
MSNSIPSQYILQYDTETRLAYQFNGGKLAPLIQSSPHQGEGAAPADFVAPTQANLNPGRLSPTPSNNATVTRRWVYPNFFDHAFQIAKQDVTRVFNGGQLQTRYAENQGKAMGRLRDDMILGSIFADSVTGKNGASTTTFPAGQKVAVNYGASANTGLTATKLIHAKQILQSGGVDLETAKLICVISSLDNEFLLKQIEIRSKEYGKGMLDGNGLVLEWLGIRFVHMEFTDTTQYVISSNTSVPAGYSALVSGSTRYIPLFDADAMYWGNWRDPSVEFGIRTDLSNATQMYATAEGGATRLQETGVTQIACV